MMATTPVARVLTEPCLILGVEKPIAIGNFVIAMVLAGELHLWGFFLLSVGLHVILAQITKRDAFTRRIYIRYVQQGHCYLPWVTGLEKSRFRPSAYAGVMA